MRLKFKLGVLLVCLLCLVSVSYAGVLVESTFDANDDGWQVGDFSGPTASPLAPTYLASGGNPGGFIRANDYFSWNAFLAPAKFLGNQSAAFGGSLNFDQRVLSTDNIDYYAVVLEGGGLQVGYSAGLPGTDWTSFSIPFTSAGWFKNLNWSLGYGGDPITPAELQNVLSNLTALRLEADWQTGGDQVDLDNVRLLSATATPVPASVLFMVTGLLGLAFGARRKNNN